MNALLACGIVRMTANSDKTVLRNRRRRTARRVATIPLVLSRREGTPMTCPGGVLSGGCPRSYPPVRPLVWTLTDGTPTPCPMALSVMLQCIMGRTPHTPPPAPFVDRQTPAKTLPSRILRNASGNKLNNMDILDLSSQRAAVFAHKKTAMHFQYLYMQGRFISRLCSDENLQDKFYWSVRRKKPCLTQCPGSPWGFLSHNAAGLQQLSRISSTPE